MPTTADRVALLALLEPLRERRDIVLVDARGTGMSGRVGERRDAYGAGAAAGDLDAVRNELGAGHVELYAAGDGARIALAYAARFGDRLRALVLDGGPSATLFAGDGRAEAHGLGKALGSGEPTVSRGWRHGCARAPCASTGGSTTTRSRVRSCARTRGRW